MNLISIVTKHKIDFISKDKRKQYQSIFLLNFYSSLLTFYDFSKKDTLGLINQIIYLFTSESESLSTKIQFFKKLSIINLYLYHSFLFTKSSIFFMIIKKMNKYNDAFFSLLTKIYNIENTYKKRPSIFKLLIFLFLNKKKSLKSALKQKNSIRADIIKIILNKNLQKLIEFEIQNSLTLINGKINRNYKF